MRPTQPTQTAPPTEEGHKKSEEQQKEKEKEKELPAAAREVPIKGKSGLQTIMEEYEEEDDEPLIIELRPEASTSNVKMEKDEGEGSEQAYFNESENFEDSDIITSFFSIEQELGYLKRATQRHMSERDKAAEDYDELCRDHEDLLKQTDKMVMDIGLKESLIEAERKRVQGFIEEVNATRQRAVAAEEQNREKDKQLAVMTKTLQEVNERRRTLQAEYDAYLENPLQMASAGSSSDALNKENAELKKALKLKQVQEDLTLKAFAERETSFEDQIKDLKAQLAAQHRNDKASGSQSHQDIPQEDPWMELNTQEDLGQQEQEAVPPMPILEASGPTGLSHQEIELMAWINEQSDEITTKCMEWEQRMIHSANLVYLKHMDAQQDWQKIPACHIH